MPIAWAHAKSATVNGKIFVFGGHSITGKTYQVYHIPAGRWEGEYEAPQLFKLSPSVLVDGKIYLMGGVSIPSAQVGVVPSDIVYEFAP
jgi:hypothetical protein